MGLLDIFKRDSGGATPAGATANVISGEQAEQARLRARRRLIGAVVLLGVGVIAFPLLFETQPRPIPVDIPIVIPPRDGAPPLVLPAVRPTAAAPASMPAVSAPASAAVATAAAAPAKPVEAPPKASEVVAAKPVAAAPKPAPEPPKAAPEPPKPAVTASKPPPADTKAADTKAAAPAPAKPAVAEAGKAAAGGRFVVQIGAFTEAAAVREARSKAGKAGLSTFTQVVETAGGPRTRVRIGPFASREEADKAAAQARAAGVPGVVMTL
jgi:DedD protein